MRKTVKFGQLHTDVKTRATDFWDETWNAPDLEFENLTSVHHGNYPYAIQETAQRQFCTKLGIPYAYMAKCPSVLQATNLNHWLRTLGDKPLFMRMDKQDVRAVFTERYKPIDNLAVMETIATNSSLSEDVEISYSWDSEILKFDLIDRSNSFQVNGDTFMAGISIFNSEVGYIAIGVAVYLRRLICSNGATIAVTGRAFRHRHISEKTINALPQAVKGLIGAGLGYRDKLQRMHDIPLIGEGQPDARIDRLDLSETEKVAVKYAHSAEPVMTEYGIFNAVTRAARDIHRATSNYHLEALSGKLIEMVRV